MNKDELKIKLEHLTIDGAREFWNEIEEWLDSIIQKCIRDYDKVKTLEELKEKQILKRLCERIKKLPDIMVMTLREQLADTSDSDIKPEEIAVNFFTEPSGVKKEGKDGR